MSKIDNINTDELLIEFDDEDDILDVPEVDPSDFDDDSIDQQEEKQPKPGQPELNQPESSQPESDQSESEEQDEFFDEENITESLVWAKTSLEVDGMLEELDKLEKDILDARSDILADILAIKKVVPEDESPVIQENGLSSKDLALFEAYMMGLNKRLDQLDDMQRQIVYMRNVIDDKLSVDFNAMYENLMEHMNIEAIKVYRNIQAVIVEENAKQNHALFGIDGKSDSLRRRLNNVILFSIISFVVSILVMLMQILPALGITIF